MECIATDVEAFHLGGADFDAFLLHPCVEGALDFEPGLCRCRCDQLDDGGMIRERPAAPILGDAAEQAMYRAAALGRHADPRRRDPSRYVGRDDRADLFQIHHGSLRCPDPPCTARHQPTDR